MFAMDRLTFEIKTDIDEQIIPDKVLGKLKNKDIRDISKSECLDVNFKVELTIEEHSVEIRSENVDPLNFPQDVHSNKIIETSSAFQCMFCMKYLISNEKLHEHINVYHPKETVDIEQNIGSQQTLQCKYCFKECANSAGLKNHVRMLHKDEKEVMEPEPKKQPNCDICNRSFKRIYELLRHMNSVHKDKTKFICKFCKGSFQTTNSLSEHTAKFHRKRNLGNDGSEKSNINYKDEPWRRFECRFCFKECANSCGLKNHLRMTHRTEKDIVELKPKEKPKCVICDRTYTRIYELMRHMKTQHDCKPFKCIVCLKIFTSKDSLTLHCEKNHGQRIKQAEERDTEIDSVGYVVEPKDTSCVNHSQEDLSPSVNSYISFQRKYCLKPCANICGLKNHFCTFHSDKNGVKEVKSKERPTCSIFVQHHALMHHMAGHNKNKYLKCEFCATAFLTEENLANHIQKVHGITVENLKFARCKICSMTYMDEKLLQEHLSKKPYSCSICCKHFIYKKEHESCRLCDKSCHSLQRSEGRNSVPGDDSELVPFKKSGIDENTNLTPKEIKYKLVTNSFIKAKEKALTGTECDVCLETFNNWDDLEKHKLTSSKYGCKICHRHFQRIISLAEHMNTHSKEKIFQCEYCTRPYLMKGSLRTHIRSRHPDKVEIQDSRIKLFFCEDSKCKQKFSLYRDLVIHMRQHKGAKPYKCDQCNRRFSVSAHLDVHKKRRHENVKPYNCDVCRKPFFRKKFMIKHFNKHTLK